MDIRAFEKAIVGGPSLAEAAEGFLKIKYAAKQVAPPDATGELEGQFAVPPEQVIALMSELVKNEFETIYAYHVYANSLRDLSHDSIAAHFEEHADDELDHSDFLMKRMSVLGGPIHVPDLQAPIASSDPVAIIKTMIRMEQEGIAGWKKLLAIVGENPMRVTIEDYAAKEQEHLDDLWQLLPHEENTPILQQKVAGWKGLLAAGAAAGLTAGATTLLLAGKGGRKQLGAEVRDPRLYSNVRGMLAGESKEERVAAHKELATASPSVLKAALTGIARVQQEKKAARDEPEQAAERAHRVRMESREHTRSEHGAGLAGRVIGAAAGAATHALHKNPVATVGATAVGQHLGSRVGMELGRRADTKRFHRSTSEKTSSVFSAMRKVAFDGNVNEWMAREQMLGQAQEQAESDYFKTQAQAAQSAVQQKDQELQGVQQQLQQIQQQQMQMQQELDQSGQMQRQVLDQARQVEQAASQSAAAAHQTATSSMLQSMQSQQEVMRHKGMTANMQTNVQAWKDQLSQIAQADPTQGAADQIGLPSGPPPMDAPPVDPMTGQPAMPPDPNAPMPTDGADPQAGPAAQAPQAEGSPAAPPAEGAGQQAPPGGEVKQSAALWAHFSKVASQRKHAFSGAQAGMGAAGAALMGGGAYLTSRMQNDPELDGRVQELEAEKARGEGSFSHAIELAKSKMLQGMGEALRDHPAMGTAASAAVGAGMGVGIGTMAPKVLGNVASRFGK